MKAGWTKIALAVWLTVWIVSMYYKAGFNESALFAYLLAGTGILSYIAGRGDGA